MNPGGILKLRSPRNWSPSSRSSFRWKLEKAPASGFDVPATRRGWNGRTSGGQGLPFGPELRLKFGLEGWSARAEFHGLNTDSHAVVRAVGRRRHQRPLRGEDVEVEGFERDLREVFEVRRDLTGFRVGMDVADQLGVDAEPIRDQEDPVLVARLRFTEVDRAFERPFEGRGFELHRPDLRVVRAFRRALAVEVRQRVGTGLLAVRRVGVDRQPRRQRDRRLLDLRGREGVALELFRLQLEVEARRRVGFVGRQRGVEDRVEVEFLATIDRRQDFFRFGRVIRGPGR